jgi:spoIIIJ-associated protein
MNAAYTKDIIEKTLTALGVPFSVEVIDDTDIHMTVFNITTEESNIMIGHNGEHLQSLSHLIKKMSDHHSTEERRASKEVFLIDINNYQRKRINELKDKATILAERAKYFKSSVEMEPMSPYERMIIHSIFAENREVATESIGQGRERRIVLKYSGD